MVVNSIFTDDMFEELESAMKKAGFEGVEGAANIFKQDYRSRKVCVVFCDYILVAPLSGSPLATDVLWRHIPMLILHSLATLSCFAVQNKYFGDLSAHFGTLARPP